MQDRNQRVEEIAERIEAGELIADKSMSDAEFLAPLLEDELEAIADAGVRAIMAAPIGGSGRQADSGLRRQAAKRVAERFGFTVTEPETDLGAAADELGIELEVQS